MVGALSWISTVSWRKNTDIPFYGNFSPFFTWYRRPQGGGEIGARRRARDPLRQTGVFCGQSRVLFRLRNCFFSGGSDFDTVLLVVEFVSDGYRRQDSPSTRSMPCVFLLMFVMLYEVPLLCFSRLLLCYTRCRIWWCFR